MGIVDEGAVSLRVSVCPAMPVGRRMNGPQLKQARRELGLSQEGLAEAIGMTRVMVGLMERGRKGIERRTDLAVQLLVVRHRGGWA